MPGLPGRNLAIRRLRALGIIAERMKGATQVEIAAKYHIHEDTVAKEIKWAEREGLIQQFEDQIASELVPMAIEAYKKALKDGDTLVAKDVLSGTGILKKQREAPRKPVEPGEMDLEIYLSKREGNVSVIGRGKSAGALAATAESAVLDGVVLKTAPSLPAGVAEDLGEHDGEDSDSPAKGFLDASDYISGEEDE